jgi:aryl-alcohol dehydrogenase-like predicted oxidoreductase
MRYRLLGPSGLRVSEAALGTMTFGETWGWGASRDECGRILDVYAEAGGNFLDTACNYTDGESERIVGELIAADRGHFVVATKYTLTARPNDPNAGGNHRKNLVQTVEGSLRRLGTDYVDLLYLHMWDSTTPVEEVLRALDHLVASGKVLHVAASDTPAWVISRANAIADRHGWAPFVAVQCAYSLAERDAERDLIPMAEELGLGVTAWGVLGGGVLTGKYSREGAATRRYDSVGPASRARGELLLELEGNLGLTAAEIAIAWLRRRSPRVIPILGARTADQLEANLAALDVRLDGEAMERLEAAFPLDLGFPHDFLAGDNVRGLIFGTTYELIDR